MDVLDERFNHIWQEAPSRLLSLSSDIDWDGPYDVDPSWATNDRATVTSRAPRPRS